MAFILIVYWPAIDGFAINENLKRVFSFVHKSLPNKFIKSIKISSDFSCGNSGAESKYFYGNQKVGYVEVAPKLEEDFLIFEIIPLTYRWSTKLWCVHGKQQTILKSYNFKQPVLPFLKELEPLSNSALLPFNFLGAVGSLDTISTDFVPPEEKSHIGVLMITNKFYEVIWAMVPSRGLQPFSRVLSLQWSADGLFMSGQEGSFRVDTHGVMTPTMRSREAIRSVRKNADGIAYLMDSTIYGRWDFMDFVIGPKILRATHLEIEDKYSNNMMNLNTADHANANTNQDMTIRDLDFSKNHAVVVLNNGWVLTTSDKGNKWSQNFLADERTAVSATLVDNNLWIMWWSGSDLIIEKYIKRKNSFLSNVAKQVPCKSRGLGRFISSRNKKLYILCQESSAKRFESFYSGNDLVIEYDLARDKWSNLTTLPQTFYSQQRSVLLSDSLFDKNVRESL